jgi:hypothetical protein
VSLLKIDKIPAKGAGKSFVLLKFDNFIKNRYQKPILQ